MKRLLLAVCLLVAGGLPAHASAFTPAQRAEIISIVRQALKKDPSILRDAVIALQEDDQAKSDEAAHAAIAAAKGQLVTPADPVAGNPHGDVTIVEFFDTRCPYCRKMEPDIDALLKKDHDIKLVYKDLPILGPASVMGTKALFAAQKQGAYLKMRAAVMKLPSDMRKSDIEATAKSLGLDWTRMERDMKDPAVQARIDANLALARKLGIEGTPALVIGHTLIPGAVGLADLEKAVAAARKG